MKVTHITKLFKSRTTTATPPKGSLIEQVQLLPYDTPYFYTSRAVLAENYRRFTKLFEAAEVCYALKANSDPRILNHLAELGCSFEAASMFEIQKLLDVGVKPSRIIYGTSVKPANHIAEAYKAGISRFAADSREEVKKIADHAPGAKVYVRTIVDDSQSVFMMSERFGAPAASVADIMLYARSLGLKLYGVSFYVGSQAAHADKWARGIGTIAPVIERLRQHGVQLEAINIGGGFPVHYDNHQDAPELQHIAHNVRDALKQLPYPVKILMEPGRGIVATSTILVTEVIARNDRANKPWLCLDAGIYNALYEAMIHQGSTRYPVKPLHPPVEPAEMLPFILAGPTGDSLDVIARDVVLPVYTDVGDRLVFEHAGAYTIAMANPFNGFPVPKLYIA